MDLLKCFAVFAEDAVPVFGDEGVEDGMDRVFVHVIYESVDGVRIYRDLGVLSMRSGCKGGEEDGTEEEVLEKHGGRGWRRWASDLLWCVDVARKVGKEEFGKTARKINRRAAQIGTDADYDEKWGS